jgi:hypothetical protein
MSDAIREAFENWYFKDTGLRAVWVRSDERYTTATAIQERLWRAWQAALQNSESEPVAAVKGWFHGECIIQALDPEAVLPAGMALYAVPQPVVPEGYVLVPKTALDGALYLAGLAVTSTDFGSQHRADFKVCCDALLSAGKGGEV